MQDLPLLNPSDSETYPPDAYHQYLKLFTHSFDFGRFDLAILFLEWLCYLIFSAFLVCKTDGIFVEWDWISVFIPIFIAFALGTIRSICCGKRSRCALSARVVFSTFAVLTTLLILFKVRNSLTWTWDAVLCPLYILFGVTMFVSLCSGIWSICLVYHETLLKIELISGGVGLTLAIIFVRFLASKLDYIDGDTYAMAADWSWWVVYSPLWALHIFTLIMSIVFASIFPNREFIEDKIIGGSGTKSSIPSIKPRYRGNFMFVLVAIFNIPFSIFSLMVCFFLSKITPTEKEPPYLVAVMFAPFFILEILALFVILGLIHARRKRGSFCIKIDNGMGVPPTEIW